MKRKITYTLVFPIVLSFVFFSSIELANADDFSAFGCQEKYSKCQKKCEGDTDCLADCQDDHKKCLEGNSGGSKRSSDDSYKDDDSDE